MSTQIANKSAFDSSVRAWYKQRMTRDQLKRHIIKRKGSLSWRQFGASIGAHFTDLHRAAMTDDTPKSGVLEKLEVKRTIETRYIYSPSTPKEGQNA